METDWESKSLKDAGTIAFLSIFVFIGILGLVSSAYLGPDNPIEEKCEDVIRVETGIDIDLSPSTPEQKQMEEQPA